MSVVLAVFSIKYVVNQIIVGVVLNVLVSGLTGFLFTTVMQSDPEKYNSPAGCPSSTSRSCPSIPVIGPILFKQSVVGYLMYVAVIVIWVGLFKTKWGLRVRAVGEHPQAADTLGIKVNATRFWNVTARRRRRRASADRSSPWWRSTASPRRSPAAAASSPSPP